MQPHVPLVVTGDEPTVEGNAGSSTSLKVMVGWTCPLKRWRVQGLPLVGSQLPVPAEPVVEVAEARLVVLFAWWQRALVGATGVPAEWASSVHGAVGGEELDEALVGPLP